MKAGTKLRCPVFSDRFTDHHVIKKDCVEIELFERLLRSALGNGTQACLTVTDVNPSSVPCTDVSAFKGSINLKRSVVGGGWNLNS